MFCAKCGKQTDRLYVNGTMCQACYDYFRSGGTISKTPRLGEIAYDSRGFVVCHICGRAYKRLGSHTRESHNMTISDYKRMFGLSARAKTTEHNYSEKMKNLAIKNDMPNLLRTVGAATQIQPGQKLRLGKKSRLRELIRSSLLNSWHATIVDCHI